MTTIITHILLIITIILFLLFVIYDAFIIQRRFGETLLLVKLRNRNRFDGLIFIGLVGVLFYQYGFDSTAPITGYLLGFLLLITIYTYLIRKPKFILKKDGFFFACIYFPYQRVKSINLTDKGVLVIKSGVRPISVYPRTLDDLEKICKTLIETNYGEQLKTQSSNDVEQNKTAD